MLNTPSLFTFQTKAVTCALRVMSGDLGTVVVLVLYGNLTDGPELSSGKK